MILQFLYEIRDTVYLNIQEMYLMYIKNRFIVSQLLYEILTSLTWVEYKLSYMVMEH